MEDEVKELSKETTAQVRFFFPFTKRKEEQNRFTTMMTKEQKTGKQKKKNRFILTH